MMNNSENVKKMVEQMYSDREQTGDVIFSVEGQQIRAHRNVLAALSPKYKAQFYGPNPDQGEIRIPNVSAAAFNEFIQFFYKKSVDLTMGNIETVLDLTKQSLVDGFVKSCVDFLKKSVTISNVCFIYRLAILYDIESLRLDCEQQIGSKTLGVFASEVFLQCDRDILLNILNLDMFNCSEANVFNACIAWAQADCKLKGLDEKNPKCVRESLGDAIYLVRFASINAEEFAALSKSVVGLFMVDELTELLCITTKMMDFVPKIFINTPRTSYGLEIFKGPPSWSLECDRFDSMLQERYVSCDELDFEFVCDNPICLHGFVLGFRLDHSIDHNSINTKAIIMRDGLPSSIKLKCKLYQNPQKKNETIFLFESLVEKITYFSCDLKLPNSQSNYELILKNGGEVGSLAFGISGKWVTRFLFDKV